MLNYLLQIIMISGLLAVYHFACLRHNANHRTNRVILQLSFLLPLVLPILNFSIPVSSEWSLGLIADRPVELNQSPGENEGTGLGAVTTAVFPWAKMAGMAALVGSAALLIRFGISLYKTIRMLRQSKPVRQKGLYLVFDSHASQPFSFFHWIIVPVALQHDKSALKAVLAHETTHARQWHSVDRMLMELIVSACWWNPFFHYLKKQILLTHEYLADEAAVQQTGVREYAILLLQQTFSPSFFPLTHSFFQSPLKTRIMMMQNTHHRRWAQWLFLPLAACCVFIFSVAFHKAPAGTAPAKSLKVVLDAGHGGIDRGAVADGLQEKDIALALVQELTKQAASSNIQFVLTREGDDLPVPGSVNESLKQRVDLVKSTGADLMLSLHLGAAQPKTASETRGIMAFVSTNAAANAGESKTLASALLAQLDGGPLPVESAIQQRTSSSVYILEKNTKPAVLLEMGFITHPDDVQVLADQQKMKELAKRLLTGLENYAARTN